MPREPIDVDSRSNEFAAAAQRYMKREQHSQTPPSILDKLENLLDDGKKCSSDSERHIHNPQLGDSPGM